MKVTGGNAKTLRNTIRVTIKNNNNTNSDSSVNMSFHSFDVATIHHYYPIRTATSTRNCSTRRSRISIHRPALFPSKLPILRTDPAPYRKTAHHRTKHETRTSHDHQSMYSSGSIHCNTCCVPSQSILQGPGLISNLHSPYHSNLAKDTTDSYHRSRRNDSSEEQH